MKIIKNKEGSLIIESMVAAALVVVGLLGMFQLIYRSSNVDNSVIDKFQATYLAAEGIEVVKNVIDTNIANSLPWNYNLTDGTYDDVSFDNLTINGSYGASTISLDRTEGVFEGQNSIFQSANPVTATIFSRSVGVSSNGGSEIDVSSTVSWVEEGNPKSVVLEDRFYNWR